MSDAQINETVTAQLVQAGYSRTQASQLLTMANTMARGRNVGAPPGWMNSTDLDRTSQAILNVRNNEPNAESALRSIRMNGPNMTEAQMRDAVQRRLVGRGYTEDQARTIVDFAARGARGQRVTIPATMSWLNVTDLTTARTGINQGLNNPDRARLLMTGLLFAGPSEQIAVREEPRPSPVRVYNYSLSLTNARGQTFNYEVTLNRDPRSVEGGRLADQFFNMRNMSGVVVAATSGDHQVSAEEFWRNYQAVYRDVVGTTGTPASIDIHGIRGRRQG